MSGTERTLMLICAMCLIHKGECIPVEENVQDGAHAHNTTTLYPVDRNVFVKPTTQRSEVHTTTANNRNADTAIWRINATFANTKHHDSDEDSKEDMNDPMKPNITMDNCKELRKVEKDFKSNAFPKDKIDTGRNKPEPTAQDLPGNMQRAKESGGETVSQHEFKPSPHVNSYYETLDDSPLPHHHSQSYASPIHTPSFLGYTSDKLQRHPVQPLEGFAASHYKHENNVPTYSVAEWGAHGLQSRPTAEAPVRIPAGGLYGHRDILKSNPNPYVADGEYNEGSVGNVHGSSINKRTNPWRKLLHLVTALLPVGLIVSALTPSIITIQNQEPGKTHHSRLSRRFDDTEAFPVISEECKRRLLCEIHSDRNYPSNGSPHRRPKQCYRIRCEDPHSVSRALRWLLAFHRTGDMGARGYI